jgi:hypothetical protein
MITIEFGKKSPKNFNKIDDSLTNTVETDIIVRSTVFESYLIHTDQNAFPGYLRNEYLLEIGRINNLVRNYFKQKKRRDRQ